MSSSSTSSPVAVRVSCHVSAVQVVYTNWVKPDARAFRCTSLEAIESLAFAAGSIGPKVEAVCDFVRTTGGNAAIGSLEEALAMLQDTA